MNWNSELVDELKLALSFVASSSDAKMTYLPERFPEPVPFFGRSGCDPLASSPIELMTFFCSDTLEAHGGADQIATSVSSVDADRTSIQALWGIFQSIPSAGDLELCVRVWRGHQDDNGAQMKLWLAAQLIAQSLLRESGHEISLSPSFDELVRRFSGGVSK